jgi:microcystin degradation protein MlrC
MAPPGAPSVAVVGVWHETNTYSACPTTLDDFRALELLEGDGLRARNERTGSVIGGFLDAEELELVPCLSASAWPGGVVAAEARAWIVREAAESLRRSGPVDGVLVNLHGAMVAEDDDDPEVAFLDAVRSVAGAVPIAAVVDLHANPSAALVSRCDVMIGYDTYPHVDMRERGREAAALLGEVLAGRRLRTLLAKVPILASPLGLGTDDEPMRGLLQRAGERSEAAGLARILITGAFSYSDVERAGVSVVVVCDEEAVEAARDVLAATAADIAANEDAFRRGRPRPAEAVSQAIASPAKPVVIADVGDNVGGGGAGDGTAILAELLAQAARSAVVLLHDPGAVELAESVGVGGTFDGEIGGKTDRFHGDPVAVRGRVAFVGDSAYTTEGTWMSGGCGRDARRRHGAPRAAVPSRAADGGRYRPCGNGRDRRQGRDRLACRLRRRRTRGDRGGHARRLPDRPVRPAAFDDSGATVSGEHRSTGLWRHAASLPVSDPERHAFSLGEGDTPLVPVDAALPEDVAAPGRILLKAEHLNPTGSYKDRIAAVAVALERASPGLSGRPRATAAPQSRPTPRGRGCR